MNSGMVACVEAEIPSRRIVFQMVRMIIRISSRILRWSTYQTSSRNLSSQEIALAVNLSPAGQTRFHLVPTRLLWRVAIQILHQ